VWQARVARSTFRSQKCKKLAVSEQFLRLGCGSAWKAQGILHVVKSESVSKTLAGVGRLKKICKDGFRVARAVQETRSSEMLGGQGAHFLRGFAFWSIRPSGLPR